MQFPKVVVNSELLPPPSFNRDIHLIEYREDPLTRARCRINIRRTRRPRQSERVADLGEITKKPPDCPFCPENIEKATPLFPEDICREGRIKRGQTRLFPNLFPFAKYHATATLTEEHFLELDQFEAGMIVDNMMATKEYLLSVYKKDKEARYPIYLWNHLPPSAASIVHPHVQVLVDKRPTLYQQRLLDSSRRYFEEMGRNFWEEIIREERARGERYIGGNGSLYLLASYAPQGNREVQIIFPGVSNLLDLDESQIEDFAHSLTKILHGYKQMGVNSFNLSTFSAPLGERLDYYFLNAKLISRPVMQPFYRNDSGILERFHYEADIEIEPEVVAQRLRAFF